MTSLTSHERIWNFKASYQGLCALQWYSDMPYGKQGIPLQLEIMESQDNN
jgi:hypothetical protein